MKIPPQTERLERALRASRLVAGGFLGTDRRPLEEIIERDAAELARLGLSAIEVADRMRSITALAESRLGAWVALGGDLEASAADTRGGLPCPWPHPGRFPKTVVTVRNRRTGETVRWSALNVHLIEAHGFFEGRGARFRLEPARLAGTIFTASRQS